MSKGSRSRFPKLSLHEELRVTAGRAHHRAPTWSSDGKFLAFSVGGLQDGAWVLTDKRGRVARTLEGPAAGAATFAPDGSLAFQRVFGATSEIWLTPGGDAPPIRLLGGDGCLYRDPVFSPDGRVLVCAVAEDPEGRSHLSLVHLDTGKRVHLPTTPQRSDGKPCFTPSGEELVFEGATADACALYAIHLGNNEAQRLTPEGERARHAAVISDQLFVYERAGADDRSQLVLCERGKHGDGYIQPLLAEEDALERRDPSCHVGKSGKVRLAYAAQMAASDGEPPRFDVYTARLSGLDR